MTNNLSNIKERILYIAEKQEGNKQFFFRKIGVTYGNFTGKNKKRLISSDSIINILSIYPNTNVEWLITGKGEMLKKEAGYSQDKVGTVANVVCNNCGQLQKEVSNLNALVRAKDETIKAKEVTISIQGKEIKRLEKENSILKKHLSHSKKDKGVATISPTIPVSILPELNPE